MTRIITVVLTITQRSQKDVKCASCCFIPLVRELLRVFSSVIVSISSGPSTSWFSVSSGLCTPPGFCLLVFIVLSSGLFTAPGFVFWCYFRVHRSVLSSGVLSSGVLVASNGPCSPPVRFLSVFLLQDFSCFLAKSPTPFLFLDSELIYLLPIHCL